MLRVPSLVLAFVAAAIAAQPALAFLVPPRTAPPLLEQLRYCGDSYLNTAGRDDAAAATASLLAAGGPRIAVRTCVDDGFRGSNTHYHVRYTGLPANGICRMHEREIFRAGAWEMADIMPDAGPPLLLRGWRFNATDNWAAHGYQPGSTEFALITDGPCPPPGDARYVRLVNASDARLRQVSQYWSAISASPAAFRDALGHVPFEMGSYMAWKRMGSEMLMEGFTESVFQKQAAPADLTCEGDVCTLDIAWDLGIGDPHALFAKGRRFIQILVRPDAVIPIKQGAYLRA